MKRRQKRKKTEKEEEKTREKEKYHFVLSLFFVSLSSLFFLVSPLQASSVSCVQDKCVMLSRVNVKRGKMNSSTTTTIDPLTVPCVCVCP